MDGITLIDNSNLYGSHPSVSIAKLTTPIQPNTRKVYFNSNSYSINILFVKIYVRIEF